MTGGILYTCPKCGATFRVLFGVGYPICTGPNGGPKHQPVTMRQGHATA